MRKPEHLDRWLIALLLLVSFALKFSWTGVNELGGDEPFTVFWAQRPLTALFGMLHTENNPPLYFVLMHYWSHFTPLDTAWLRIPSALFSALTVWPLFLLGKRLGGRSVAITASLLFTFSQHHYGFAHEVRTYSLLTFACTWAVWQLVRLSDGPERHPSLRPYSIVWLVVANMIAVWAHYFGSIMVGIELVMVFTVPMLRPARVKMLAAAGLTVLTMLPMARTVFSRADSSLAQGTWVAPPAWDEPYSMLVRWSNAPVVAVIFLILILLALLRKRGSTMAMGLLWCGLPLIGMFLVSFFFPMYIDRYLLFASIGFYLVVAEASQIDLGKDRPKWLVPAGCVVAMACTFTPWKDTGSHPSKVVAQVQAWSNEHTAVVIQPAWYDLTYAWALDPQLFRAATPVDMALTEKGIFPLLGSQAPALDTSITTVVHIDAWAALTDPQLAVLHDLHAHFVLTDSSEADRKVWLRRFQRK
ncbi:MAG: glycosyltransferase family 39 protein [Flavobacteriales bacterium]